MSDKQKIIADTIADIIAEKRRRIEEIRCNLSAVPVRRDEQLAEIECIEVEVIRLEAAWKREKAECEAAATSKMLEGAIIIDNRGCGNTAAMCAALEQMLAVAAEMREEHIIAPRLLMDGWANTIESVAKSALSTPPTISEEYAKPKLCKSCAHYMTDGCEICGCTDYKEREGETNGSK